MSPRSMAVSILDLHQDRRYRPPLAVQAQALFTAPRERWHPRLERAYQDTLQVLQDSLLILRAREIQLQPGFMGYGAVLRFKSGPDPQAAEIACRCFHHWHANLRIVALDIERLALAQAKFEQRRRQV